MSAVRHKLNEMCVILAEFIHLLIPDFPSSIFLCQLKSNTPAEARAYYESGQQPMFLASCQIALFRYYVSMLLWPQQGCPIFNYDMARRRANTTGLPGVCAMSFHSNAN